MHEMEHFPFILFLAFVFRFPLVIFLVPAIQYLPWPSFPPRPCARVDSSFKPMPGIEDPFLSGFCLQPSCSQLSAPVFRHKHPHRLCCRLGGVTAGDK